MRVKLLAMLYYCYIVLVYKTSKIEFIDVDERIDNSIVGFWHGDSFLTNFILLKFKGLGYNFLPLITEDPRGEYIVNVCKKLDARAILVRYSIKMIETMKELNYELNNHNIIVVALDGPLGPKFKPKSMAYRLSKNGQRHMFRMEFEIKRKIILSKRWDDYIIPLPFCKIIVRSVPLGIITKEKLDEVKKM